MGYFDGLTEASFKKDAEGRTLFYPWGVLGKGRVLPNPDKAQQIRRFIRLYHMVSLPAAIVSATFNWLVVLALITVGRVA